MNNPDSGTDAEGWPKPFFYRGQLISQISDRNVRAIASPRARTSPRIRARMNQEMGLRYFAASEASDTYPAPPNGGAG